MGFSRRFAVAIVCVATLLAVEACGTDDTPADTAAGKDVEVFTWWAEGGEKAGLDELVKTFESNCSKNTFLNASVAGGAGGNAKQVLATRLQLADPPDTFQAHAGAELNDYIDAGQIEDLSAQYREWGLTNTLPKGLIDSLTVKGKIYSVPANIHRANVLWSNRKVTRAAGVPDAPASMAEFLGALENLRAKGIARPLAVGKNWTQLMLLEAVLISDLGPGRFGGLWTGGTDFGSTEVATAFADYRRLLEYSNTDRDTFDWTDGERLLIEGKAAYQLMGDWEAADLNAKGFTDYGNTVFPGNAGAFQWLADSFVLPKGAKNAAGTKCWLKTVGSADGQRAFNTKKGSIPARTDANPADYPAYQQSAMADWKSGVPVPSCAHGSACSHGLQALLNAAVAKFSDDLDVEGLKKSMSTAVAQFAKR